ncbi:MAG TPA: hypothetical protein VFI06_09005 [Chitinophagaceae bacterium]|nr:hypothetical protein [Chitinophagaceae bacterium]
MKRFFLFCLVVEFAQFIYGQDQPILLTGKIDKYPIIMELSPYDTSYNARYFYLNQRKDINLEGSIDDKGNIRVAFTERGEDDPVEWFELKKSATGYSGNWHNGKKNLPVSLTQTTVEKYNNPYAYLPGIQKLKKESPYDYVKTASFSFTKTHDSKLGTADFEWYKEKYSDIELPRVKSGYSPQAIKKMNDVLLEKHLLESNDYLACMSEPDHEYHLEIPSVFAHKNILSIEIFTSYDCGGAHPDFGSEGLSFDGVSGNLLKLDEVIWFSKAKPPTEYSDTWYTYRSNVFAPAVVKLLKKIYPSEMKATEDDGCDYNREDVWDFPSWHFTEKGLYLGAIFGRAARACDNPEFSIIPYKQLKPWLNPNSKLKLPE